MIEMLDITGEANTIEEWLAMLTRDYASGTQKVLANVRNLFPDGLSPEADSVMVDRYEVKLMGKVRYVLEFKRYQIINGQPYVELAVIHK